MCRRRRRRTGASPLPTTTTRPPRRLPRGAAKRVADGFASAARCQCRETICQCAAAEEPAPPALTTRGMEVAEMAAIAGWIAEVLEAPTDEARIRSVRGLVEELCEVVAAASKIRVLGQGHSFVPVCHVSDAAGTLISLSKMCAVLELDEEAGTVTVEGGINYSQLTGYLSSAARPWARARVYGFLYLEAYVRLCTCAGMRLTQLYIYIYI